MCDLTNHSILLKCEHSSSISAPSTTHPKVFGDAARCPLGPDFDCRCRNINLHK